MLSIMVADIPTGQHEVEDVIDMEVMPGEYIVYTNEPMKTIELFGEKAQAWFYMQAARSIINRKWQSRCECCNHRLRYVVITKDDEDKYHAFGQKCASVKMNGSIGARRLELFQQIEQKAKKDNGKFCATFAVPQQFWNLPREQRPDFASPWKATDYKRSRGGRNVTTWKLSVWGVTLAECIDNCLELERIIGVQLR